MKNPTLLASLVILTAFAASSSFASHWDGYDSPEKMSRGRYSYNYNDVPDSGRLTNDRIPWAETYWPTRKGGLAYRWATKRVNSWSYKLYTRDELKKMSQEEIAILSPAEKFDIWQGDYSYPTVRRERGRTSPSAADWAGLCHGWVPAALNHKEPSPKTVTNADGIRIPFGSSDIKGMLTFYYGKVNWKPWGWTGSKCGATDDGPLGRLFGGCNGINAGTVHLVITNQIGRLNEGFDMDRDRGHEIWNQPFFGYKFKSEGSCRVSGSGRSAGAVKGVLIKMVTDYVDELDYSQFEPEQHVDPATGLVMTNSLYATYRYCLELDRDDKVVGGEWYSKNRPGYIFNHSRNDFAHPYWGRVVELTND